MKASTPAPGRWAKPVAVGVSIPLLAFATVVFVMRIEAARRDGAIAFDYFSVREFGQRWWLSGSMYTETQLAGPFDPRPYLDPLPTLPSMYPPAAGPLFWIVGLLPWPVWWIVPLAVLAFALWRWRPGYRTWPVLASIVAWPETLTVLLVGSTTMWMVAFVAAGLLWRWPGVLVLLKPSMAPFAIIGARSRGWWVGFGVLALLTLLGPWQDYVTVVLNSGTSPVYSLGSYVVLSLPVVAWSGRRRARSPRASPRHDAVRRAIERLRGLLPSRTTSD